MATVDVTKEVDVRAAVIELRDARRRAAAGTTCPHCGLAHTLRFDQAERQLIRTVESWFDGVDDDPRS